MDNMLFIAAGGVLGWMSYSYLRWNEARGMIVAIIIGAVGAFLGATAIAPMFITAAAAAFSAPLLLFAAIGAGACLMVGNLLHQRWGL